MTTVTGMPDVTTLDLGTEASFTVRIGAKRCEVCSKGLLQFDLNSVVYINVFTHIFRKSHQKV